MTKLERIIKTIDEIKGNDIQVIDVSNVNPLCQYFVICDANNTTQTTAIASHIEKELLDNNEKIHHIEGRRGSKWVLIDAYDIVVHIFYTPERERYCLDKLYADQPFIDISNYIKD